MGFFHAVSALLISGILLLSPVMAVAQSIDQRDLIFAEPEIILREDDTETDIFALIETLAPETQSELKEEARQAQKYCESSIMLSNYYDCNCYAVKFLESRFEHGPDDIIFVHFVRDIDFRDCVFEPQIAGVNYQRCLQMIGNTRWTPDQEEDICQCVGRRMAASFAANPLRNSRQISNLFVTELSTCRRALQ